MIFLENTSSESTLSDIIPPTNWSLLSARQTHIEVKYHPYKFTVYVSREQGLYKIRMGKQKECIYISVYDDEDDAYINSFRTDELCGEIMSEEERLALLHIRSKSLNSKNIKNVNISQVESQVQGLLPGFGTISLFKAACMVVFRLFPKVTSISFKDTSKIISKINSSISVSLSTLYIVKHGETWYENKFGAVAMNSEYREKLSVGIKNLLEEKLPKDFDNFFENHITPKPRGAYMRQIPIKILKQELKKMYPISGNLRDFVKKIIDEYDCLMLEGWLEKYVCSKIGWNEIHESWMITREITSTWNQRSWEFRIIETKNNVVQNKTT